MKSNAILLQLALLIGAVVAYLTYYSEGRKRSDEGVNATMNKIHPTMPPGRKVKALGPSSSDLLPRACIVCGRNASTERELDIFENEQRSWRKRSRPLCSGCTPRMDRAAKYGAVLHTAQKGLIVDFLSEQGWQADRSIVSETGGEIAWASPNPVVAAICLLSVLVIAAFGALASFGSPMFFLGAMIPFAPLALVAYRSGNRKEGKGEP